MTKKIVSLLIALCMVLSVASAFAEKLTITYWDENFNDGAMSLEKVGDVTMTPVVSSSGVHIIRYESDVTGGPVPLEDIREKLHDTTLQDRKDDHYDDVLSGIVEALNPVYHMDAFNIA